MSANSLHLAYGRKAHDPLSQSEAATWIEHLWQMHACYTLLTRESSFDPKGFDQFISFRELIRFFQQIGEIKRA